MDHTNGLAMVYTMISLSEASAMLPLVFFPRSTVGVTVKELVHTCLDIAHPHGKMGLL